MDNNDFNPGDILDNLAKEAEDKARNVTADFEEKAEAAEEAVSDTFVKAEDFAEEAREAAEEKAEEVKEAVSDAADDAAETAEAFAEEAKDAFEEKAEEAEEDSVSVLDTLIHDDPGVEDTLEKPASARKPSIPQYVPKTYERSMPEAEPEASADEPAEDNIDILEPVGGSGSGVKGSLNRSGGNSSKTVLWIILAVLVCLCLCGCCLIQGILAVLRVIARM